jgi:hypothetical protein
VPAGRCFRALKLLVKQKRMAKTEPVPFGGTQMLFRASDPSSAC